MESQAARAKVAESKVSPDKIKENLQKILTAMNDYIRTHHDTVRSPTSERLLSIKKIASKIYSYYRQDRLITDFESNLSDFFNFLDDAKLHKKSIDTSHLKLLPELKDIHKSDVLPRSLHGYHEIIRLIQDEIKKMPSMLGRSELRDKLVTAISGSDTIAQELGSNVYLAVYSDTLNYSEMLKRPADFANYLYEALTTSRIYQDGLVTATFNGNSKSYHVTFCSSKDEAVKVIKESGHAEAACFGTEFSFTLRKSSLEDAGQYLPLLASVRQMDIWETTKSHAYSNQYALECHASKPEFVLAKAPTLTALKKQ